MMPSSSIHTSESKKTAPLPKLKQIALIFDRYPDIQAVYLFGSFASGRAYVESDLDLAIVPRPNAKLLDKLGILADLTRLGLCDIDLVILDTDNIVLKHESVRQNYLIYQAEDFDSGGYYSKVMREYLDFLPYLAVQRHAYKTRILHGQT